jgi:hypothetical protein
MAGASRNSAGVSPLLCMTAHAQATAAATFLVALIALQPAGAQPAAPDPRTTIPEKIAPPADDLSEKLDRSGGVIPPPADPGPGIVIPPPEPDPAPDMPVIRPPGTPGGDPSIQPK